MKFHAIVSDDTPAKLICELNDLRGIIERSIVEPYFKVPIGSFGPAELFVQTTNLGLSRVGSFINYEISGVTYKPERDFKKALEAMQEILVKMVKEHWKGNEPVQIMIVIHASNEEEPNFNCFFESRAIYCSPETGELFFKK